MTWQHHFNRARQSLLPVGVDKQQVGPIPPGFEAQGLTINGLWGVYERQQGVETIKITELPAQYRLSVSNMVAGNNQLQQPRTDQLQQPTTTSTHQGEALKGLAALGLLIGGAIAVGKALGSESTTIPDPKQAHRVFISHSWRYEDHFQDVKGLLDDAYGFEWLC